MANRAGEIDRLRRVASMQELRREKGRRALAEAQASRDNAQARLQSARDEESAMEQQLTDLMAGEAFDCGAYTALLGIHRAQMVQVRKLDTSYELAEAEADAARTTYRRTSVEAGLLAHEIKRLSRKLQRKRLERNEATQLDLHNTQTRSRPA